MAESTASPDLHPAPRHADGRALSAEEERNVAAMERFRALYNGEDMARFVREAYAESFHVLNLDGSGWTATRPSRENLLMDAELFIRAEAFITSVCPTRRMLFRRVIPAGNVVTVEASIVDEARPGWELSWCGVYSFDGEGRIVSDHSYLNRADWPGIREMLGDR